VLSFTCHNEINFIYDQFSQTGNSNNNNSSSNNNNDNNNYDNLYGAITWPYRYKGNCSIFVEFNFLCIELIVMQHFLMLGLRGFYTLNLIKCRTGNRNLMVC